MNDKEGGFEWGTYNKTIFHNPYEVTTPKNWKIFKSIPPHGDNFCIIHAFISHFHFKKITLLMHQSSTTVGVKNKFLSGWIDAG